MKSTNENKIVIILFCILLSIFLLLLSYKIVLLFTHTTLAQENVFRFLAGKEQLSARFAELEVSHLEDVARVMKYVNYVFYFLLLAVTLSITYYRKDKKFLAKLFEYGGKVTILSMLIISGLSALFFEKAFTLFHALFFPQGNWQFAADSKIIQTFPFDFFMSISRNIFLLSLFLGIVFILLGLYFKYVHGNRN